MAKTNKAIKHEKKKVLKQRLKEQNRNATSIARCIAKTEKELWKLELDDLKDTGLLQQLTWEFVPDVKLWNCRATGFSSVEHTMNSKIVKRIQKWSSKHEENDFGFVSMFRTTIDDYKILIALQMDYQDCNEEDEDGMVVTIFAIDNEESFKGSNAEKKALKTFVKKWNIDVDI